VGRGLTQGNDGAASAFTDPSEPTCREMQHESQEAAERGVAAQATTTAPVIFPFASALRR
jgi:hypothetical protein